jgi:hypothetical protein
LQQRVVTLTKPENVSRRNNNNKTNQVQPPPHGVLYLSLKMLVGSLITCTSLSFCLGRWTRSVMTTMAMMKNRTDDTSGIHRINLDDDFSCLSYGACQPAAHLDNASFLVDINVEESPSSSSSISYQVNEGSPPPLLLINDESPDKKSLSTP